MDDNDKVTRRFTRAQLLELRQAVRRRIEAKEGAVEALEAECRRVPGSQARRTRLEQARAELKELLELRRAVL